MPTTPDAFDEVLAKLAKEVESAVHALYRRQAGPHTTQVRTEIFVRDARDRVASILSATPSRASGPTSAGASPGGMPPGPAGPPAPRFSAALVASSVPSGAGGAEWTAAEAAAVTKCVMAWLSMGSPANAKPDSRCLAPGRELLPLWGERELARNAIRKVPVAGQ